MKYEEKYEEKITNQNCNTFKAETANLFSIVMFLSYFMPVLSVISARSKLKALRSDTEACAFLKKICGLP